MRTTRNTSSARRSSAALALLLLASAPAIASAAAGAGVIWSLEQGAGCGAVNASGLYTAPATPTSCRVVATSAADPVARAAASVTVIPAPQSVITVAQDGSGGYQTIQAAADAATPGTTIRIRAGTYHEAVTVRRSGTADAFITFQADPGVVIDGTKTLPTSSYAGLVTFHNRSYLRFIDLNVVNSAQFGFYGQYAHDVVIQGGSVSAIRHGGIYLSDGSNLYVDGVDVHGTNDLGRTASGESISVSHVDGFEVKNCKVHDSAEEGIDAKDGSTNGLVHHNDVFNNGSVQIYVDMASDLRIYANRIHGCGKSQSTYCFAMGIEGGRTGVADEVRGVSFYNNLVYDSGFGGVGFWSVDTGVYADLTFVNNTFHGISGPAFPVNVSASLFQGTNVVRNNVFWSLGSTAFSGSGVGALAIDHNLFATGQRSTTFGASPVLASDVAFVDPAAQDFELSSRSPAVDAGSAALAPELDFAGRTRAWGTGPDIGAYEYAP